ncbi:MAG TPA: hypothetical protein VHB21_19415 [Minicystis sp.]|nr:hypothetical protein [Minicystis sp.]
MKGVRVKLADGTIRSIPAKDVKHVTYAGSASEQQPAPPPPAAAPAAPPAVGLAPPAPSPPAPAGSLLVAPQAPGGAELQPEGGAEARSAFAARSGAHVGFGAELVFADIPNGGFAFFGGLASFVLNVGVAPAADLRVTAFAGAAQGDFTMIPLGGTVDARLDIGPTYSMAFGVRGGAELFAGSNGSLSLGFVGPEASLVGFRFGDRRQFSVEIWNRLPFYPAEGTNLSIETAASFQMLFLDAKQRS